jgi:hypothetical protein
MHKIMALSINKLQQKGTNWETENFQSRLEAFIVNKTDKILLGTQPC